MKFLANNYKKIQNTTNEQLFSYSPGICMGNDNRIIVTAGASGNNDVLENGVMYI